MPKSASRTRRPLGEILVAAGVLTVDELERALVEQSTSPERGRLGSVIVRMGLAREDDIASALAAQLHLEEIDLSRVPPDHGAVARVPRSLALRHLALPMRVEGDVLTVATSDPTNVVARDDLRTAAGVNTVRFAVSTETAVREALRQAYGTDQSALEALRGDGDVETVEEHDLDEEGLEGLRAADDQPIVKLANLILAEAVHARASDVHIEPGRTNLRVRYRVDGMLRDVMRVPREASAALVSRLKIMARLDIAERRRPQDGRTVVRVEGQEVDLRVSVLPTMHGETIVLRLLRKGAEQIDIEDVGLEPDHLELFRAGLQRPQGLVIITGPTGSGKTSTLYAGLTEIADPVRNIVTLEDPVEYQLEGVNQTQIHDKVGLSFARGLRSILRQDPDVVLVGEIRDQETAQLAMQASMTGHLVLSTLHTNDAPSSVVRLVDLGVEPFLIASSLLLVVGQRLVRTVCEHCAEPAEPDARIVEALGITESQLGGASLRVGTGCEICGRSGYRGRVGIFEVLPITAAIRELLLTGATETAIARLAKSEGMRTMREDGVLKALEGVTTLEEVLRATPAETVQSRRCPNCGHHVSDIMVACPHCATDLGLAACPSCSHHIESDWTTCPYCRASLGAGRRQAAPAPAPSAPENPTPEEPAPKKAKRGRKAKAPDEPVADDGARLPVLLVVDDDPSIREMVGLLLVDEYEVLEAEDGDAALQMAARHAPDVILLDLKLPDVDGLDVTRKLRDDETTRWIPVLVITGMEDAQTEVESLLAGVDDYLRKPFDDEVLRSRLLAARLRHATV